MCALLVGESMHPRADNGKSEGKASSTTAGPSSGVRGSDWHGAAIFKGKSGIAIQDQALTRRFCAERRGVGAPMD